MTVAGLPLHVLVIHAVVVLLPLMALLTVLTAVRASLRERWAWWVVAGNAAILVLTLVAKESGEDLQRALGGQIAREHGQIGAQLPTFALVVLLGSTGIAVVRGRRTLQVVATVVTVLACVVAVVWTVRTGDSGARAVWEGRV